MEAILVKGIPVDFSRRRLFETPVQLLCVYFFLLPWQILSKKAQADYVDNDLMAKEPFNGLDARIFAAPERVSFQFVYEGWIFTVRYNPLTRVVKERPDGKPYCDDQPGIEIDVRHPDPAMQAAYVDFLVPFVTKIINGEFNDEPLRLAREIFTTGVANPGVSMTGSNEVRLQVYLKDLVAAKAAYYKNAGNN